MSTPSHIVVAERVVAAPHELIFELIADPANQPQWDGNGNLAEAAPGQRVHGCGDMFVMRITSDKLRENHVVEFEEGRLIAWCPASPGEPPAGHLWRWELLPLEDGTTRVRHTYDWTRLSDPARVQRAQQNTSAALDASIQRLAKLAERTSGEPPK